WAAGHPALRRARALQSARSGRRPAGPARAEHDGGLEPEAAAGRRRGRARAGLAAGRPVAPAPRVTVRPRALVSVPVADAATPREGPPLRLGPFIVRAAAWPIETLDRLRSRRLAEEVDRWLDRERAVREAGGRLSDALHHIVPRIHDARRRGLALALRRHLCGPA